MITHPLKLLQPDIERPAKSLSKSVLLERSFSMLPHPHDIVLGGQKASEKQPVMAWTDWLANRLIYWGMPMAIAFLAIDTCLVCSIPLNHYVSYIPWPI